MLGERHRRNTPAGQSSTAGAGPTEVASSAPTVAVDGPSCPDPAQQAAAVFGSGDLRQIFRIVTKPPNTATVWICEDPRGNLFYQSHTLLNGKDLPLKQNSNGLFLPGVARTGSGFEVFDQYQNRFEITRQKFQIFFVSGKVQSDDVAKVEG